MIVTRIKKLVVGVAVLAAPAFAMAQSAEQLIQKYTPLAGSEANATALVNGLRDGTEVVMVIEPVAPPPPPPLLGFGFPPPPPPPPPAPTEVRCVPPTGKMGFGNVDNALTLGQGSLANANIVTGNVQSFQRPVTPQDVCTVLVGGEVTTPQGTKINLPGILLLRSQDNGWGQIALLVGAKL
jgi:hypothetical protein